MTTDIAVLYVVEYARDAELLLLSVADALEVEDTPVPETETDDEVELVASTVELDNRELEPEEETLPDVALADELPEEEEMTEEADEDEDADEDELTGVLGLLAT